MITTFRKVSIRGEKNWRCPCGRRVRRVKEFYQTQNPWNRTKDGIVKGRDQIYSEIVAERRAWLDAEPGPCAHAPKEQR